VTRATVSLTALVAVSACLFAVAGPAGAASPCVLRSTPQIAPYLLSPCDGAQVKPHSAVTFTAFDRDPLTSRYPPYLSLSTTRKVIDGRLVPTTNGDGILHTLTPVPGTAHMWTLTADPEPYPSWWDNRPGTYFVQIEQVDDRPANGTYSSPIVTIHVR
jgi:hypothetical protein